MILVSGHETKLHGTLYAMIIVHAYSPDAADEQAERGSKQEHTLEWYSSLALSAFSMAIALPHGISSNTLGRN